jgi:hypothetical protein
MPRRTVTLIAASFIACAGSAKREAATLVAEVDRYRRADNSSKAAEVQRIAEVACTDAKVCGAKRACLAAIDPTARALTLKDEVAHRLVDIERKRISVDSADAQGLPAKLDEAEKLLNQGRAKMPDCEKKLADLELEYGV